MRILSIHLQNYRCHASLKVEFGTNFTALVGVNGRGKTSILNALELSMFAALHGHKIWADMGAVRLVPVAENGRYRLDPRFPLVVLAEAQVFSTPGELSARAAGLGAPLMMHSSFPHPLMELEGAGSFPILAYYKANRSWNSRTNGMIEAAVVGLPSRDQGYRHWENASEGAADLKTWAIGKSLERFQTSSETGILFDDILDDELALVNGAIHEAIEEFRGLRYDMKSKRLLVQTQHEFMPFDNLSDGQQGTIGLVADIARRMCILNPQLGDATIRETEGVVLIDELDLHLHPGWQRNLTRGLKKAFPKVQFIVTSHSPQILAELQPEEIILLEGGGSEHPQVSYGLDASRVLEEVMGTASRPVEIEEKLKQLFHALESDSLDEAARQLESLREKAPGVAELSRAEALLERKKILGR